MSELLLGDQREIYAVAFFLAVTVVVTWEGFAPRRRGQDLLRRRWRGNIALGIINVATVHLILPVTAIGFSIAVQEYGGGILRWIDSPFWVSAIIGFLAIDFGRYLHHYLLHRVPFLWRMHRIHHADQDYDFTVGLRFHPFEGLFVIIFAFGVIALVGPPPIAVLVAEVAIAVSGLVIHANGRTPRWVEKYVRMVFVTPDMHRVHHSVVRAEHNSNFSGLHSFWDKIFGTYISDTAAPQDTMEIGLPDLRAPECLNLSWMLLTPLRRTQPTSPVNPRRKTASDTQVP